MTLDTTTSESAIADNAVTAGTDGKSYISAANYNGGTTTLAGTAEAGDSVMVSVNGGAGQAASVAADGSWSLSVTGLTDGTSYSAVATATDPAGNTAQSAAYAFTVDTQPPAAPTGLADAAIAQGYVNKANDTATQALTGTAEAGSTVTSLQRWLSHSSIPNLPGHAEPR